MTTRKSITLLRPLGSRASPILSHTLFGATCWALATLGHDVTELLGAFEGGARFVFSGAYPFVWTKDREAILLLPRPPMRVPSAAVNAGKGRITERVDQAKKLQKAAYVTRGVAEKLRSGEWDASALYQALQRKHVRLLSGALWLDSEVEKVWGKRASPGDLWRHTVTQRNSVDRVAGATGEGLLFQQAETFYDRDRAGLWFALHADEELWDDLQGALRFALDTGLGAKRSVGKGHFESTATLAWTDVFPEADGTRQFLSLSHYVPQTPPQAEAVAYQLDVIRKKAEKRYPQGDERIYVATLRAFRPGGVFSVSSERRAFYGRLLQLGPLGDHIVHYNGLAFPLWGAWEV